MTRRREPLPAAGAQQPRQPVLALPAPKPVLLLPPGPSATPTTNGRNSSSTPDRSRRAGIAGAKLGDLVDGVFATSGLGSLVLGAVGALAAGRIKDADPDSAAIIEAMAAGALANFGAKAAAKVAKEAEDNALVEEAKKALKEMDAIEEAKGEKVRGRP